MSASAIGDSASERAVEPPLSSDLRVRHHGELPVMALRVVLPGGSALETVSGLALVTGQLLAEGTSRRDWRRLSRELDERGIALSASAALESHGLALDCLADDWQWAVEIVGELILESTFPADRCEWVREQAAAELDSLRDRPEVRTAWAFLEELYRGHPAARPLQGTHADLARISPPDCVAFHRRALSRGPLITVAGGIDEQRVARALERIFGEACEPQWNLTWPVTQRTTAGRRVVDLQEVDQDHLYAGLLTVARDHADFAALELLGVVLGSGPGFSGRLPDRLRERDGLTYAVEVSTVGGAGHTPGRLEVYCATGPKRAGAAEEAIREELLRLPESLEQSDLDEARSYLLGREPLLRETARQWADLLAEAAFYQQPYENREWLEERYLAVDLMRLAAVSRRYLDPDRLIVVRGTGSSSPEAVREC